MLDVAVVGGTVVSPEIGMYRADIGVVGERVALIADPGRLPVATRSIDATGKLVLPGIIDPHVHFGSYVPFETDIEHETRAAVAGGVTTVGWFVRSALSYHEVVTRLGSTAEQHASTDFFIHPILSTEQHLAELPSYVEQLGTTSFKLYMAGLSGIFNSVDDDFLYRAFARVASLGPDAIACVHAENETLVERETERVAAEPGPHTLRDWSRARPTLAGVEAIHRAATLARAARARIYLVHLNSADEVAATREAKARWAGVFAEAGSHYLSLTVDHPLGALVKRSPPLRESADVEALWQGIADGTIDTIGTDNVVGSRERNRPESGVLGAKVGFTVLGTHLPVTLEEGHARRGVDLVRIVRAMTMTPAQLFGLYPRKGTIAVGSDADLVVVDPNARRPVDVRQVHTWSDFSPWQGVTLRAWPVVTILRGTVVAEGGAVLGAPGSGRYVARRLGAPPA